MMRCVPRSTLFPYTTLFRSLEIRNAWIVVRNNCKRIGGSRRRIDRKSTRLNSSHRCTSYAGNGLKNKEVTRLHLISARDFGVIRVRERSGTGSATEDHVDRF